MASESVSGRVANLVNKLVDASKTIHNRMGLKAAEEKRVKEAIALLAQGVDVTRLTRNQKEYLVFLKRLRILCGLEGVVLVAAGVGMSAIVTAKERLRADLPVALRDRKDDIFQERLQQIASKYRLPSPSMEAPMEPPPTSQPVITASPLEAHSAETFNASTFQGDTYLLTLDDIQFIAQSDQMVDRILLIDTFAEQSNSFVVVPISPTLANHFAWKRPNVSNQPIVG